MAIYRRAPVRYQEACTPLPAIRCRTINEAPVRPAGAYVLYWMTAFRRPQWNFALDHAVGWARSLNRPLLIFEALRVGYPWACDRFHRFVLQGMADNAAYCHDVGVTYFPYVEPTAGAGKGLLERLSQNACVVGGRRFSLLFLAAHAAARRHRRVVSPRRL